MDVVIVDYGSGNLHSAAKAFERQARADGRPIRIVVSGEPGIAAKADRLVLPGVGAYGDCRDGLRRVDGLWDAVIECAITRARPFFGICVGMQLMATRGLEHGRHDGFGWIAGEVDHIRPADPALKVPHMGWNELRTVTPHPVFDDLGPHPHAYFVHSFAFRDVAPEMRLAEVDHGGPVIAAVGRDTMIGTQFHPEKSQHVGLKLIGNFLRWAP
ncbi:MAG: imidazole glycerol phosphate synthase subunit HisH [Pseudomonadota bacterium]|nr:imidazole glycerol phosphate synthase subunit HisH [Pseudomonadota bacterium]